MRVLFTAACLTLAACAGPAPLPPNPPAYQAGWDDGCSSGNAASGAMYARPRKDAVRFQSDPLYADGWKDGYEHCKGNREHTQRLLGPAL